MKKSAFVLLFGLLAACTTVQQQDASKLLANAKTQIASACAVVQPTLVDIAAAYPTDASVSAVVKANGAFCAGAASVDQTNAQTIINTTIPQLISAISALPIDAEKKTTIQIALGAASVALSNFLMVYGQQASAPVGASS
jgi:hypothetical protein